MKDNQNSYLSQKISSIAGEIAEILDIDYFINLIGQTRFHHLLKYILGLILLERDKTMTAISIRTQTCVHDSLQKLLKKSDIDLQILSEFFIKHINILKKNSGWLMLDDTVISKKYAEKIECAGYAYSGKERRVIFGIHLVTLFWSDGFWRIPVGFRLWRPKDKTDNYKTKLELGKELINDNIEFCCSCNYIAFDSWYCSKKFMKFLSGINLSFVSKIPKNRNIILEGNKMKVSCVNDKERKEVYLPGYGEILVCCGKKCDRLNWYVSSNLDLTYDEVLEKYDSRWPIEEHFRFMKQNLGLEDCQCRKDKCILNHIIIVYLSCFVIEKISKKKNLNWYRTCKKVQGEYYGFDK